MPRRVPSPSTYTVARSTLRNRPSNSRPTSESQSWERRETSRSWSVVSVRQSSSEQTWCCPSGLDSWPSASLESSWRHTSAANSSAGVAWQMPCGSQVFTGSSPSRFSDNGGPVDQTRYTSGSRRQEAATCTGRARRQGARTDAGHIPSWEEVRPGAEPGWQTAAEALPGRSRLNNSPWERVRVTTNHHNDLTWDDRIQFLPATRPHLGVLV